MLSLFVRLGFSRRRQTKTLSSRGPHAPWVFASEILCLALIREGSGCTRLRRGVAGVASGGGGLVSRKNAGKRDFQDFEKAFAPGSFEL